MVSILKPFLFSDLSILLIKTDFSFRSPCFEPPKDHPFYTTKVNSTFLEYFQIFSYSSSRAMALLSPYYSPTC